MMLEIIKDTLIICYEKKIDALCLYYVWNDGSKSLYTQFELSELKTMTLDESMKIVGMSVLASTQATGDILINNRID